MTRGKAHDPAGSRFRLSDDQPLALDVDTPGTNVRLQGREVVVENKSRRIDGIARTARARIPRTQIAFRIVFGRARRLAGSDLTLPRTRGTMRRHQHPLVGKGVEPAMRIFVELKGVWALIHGADLGG